MQSSLDEGLWLRLYEKPDYTKITYNLNSLPQSLSIHLEKDIIILSKSHKASCTDHIHPEAH